MSEARQPRVIVSDPSDARMVNYAGILGDVWELFERKSKDYTNSGGQVFEDSGLMGQFMKMRDKISKLKKPLWDREIRRQAAEMAGRTDPRFTAETPHLNLEFEGPEEIIMDLIGHCLLAISVLRERDRRDRQAKNFRVDPDGTFVYDPATPGENDLDAEESEPVFCGKTRVDTYGSVHTCNLRAGHSQRLCSDGSGFEWKRKL